MAFIWYSELSKISTLDLLSELKRRYTCLDLPEKRVVFMGPPGAGLRNAISAIKRSYCLCQISASTMLSEAAAAGNDKVKAAMSSGSPVSDDVMLGLVEEKLNKPECARGFAMDGFPTSVTQAERLEGLLRKYKQKIDKVITFSAPDDVLVKREVGTLVHPASGRTYHVESKPPMVAGKDDVTGDALVASADSEASVRAKLAKYHSETGPVLDYFKMKSIVEQVDASKDAASRADEALRKL